MQCAVSAGASTVKLRGVTPRCANGEDRVDDAGAANEMSDNEDETNKETKMKNRR